MLESESSPFTLHHHSGDKHQKYIIQNQLALSFILPKSFMAALQTQHYIVDKILTKYTTQNQLALYVSTSNS